LLVKTGIVNTALPISFIGLLPEKFIDPVLGRATPYGVYDLNLNEGFVSVEISLDAVQFTVDGGYQWERRNTRMLIRFL
jgi:hypothetical protein